MGERASCPSFPERAGRPFPYFAPLRRLHPLQSIWRLLGTVWPPSLHGVMWSASISSMANFFPHFGQTPP